MRSISELYMQHRTERRNNLSSKLIHSRRIVKLTRSASTRPSVIVCVFVCVCGCVPSTEHLLRHKWISLQAAHAYYRITPLHPTLRSGITTQICFNRTWESPVVGGAEWAFLILNWLWLLGSGWLDPYVVKTFPTFKVKFVWFNNKWAGFI